MTQKRFSIVYADPPWKYHCWSKERAKPGRVTPYSCMTTEEICRLPVANIADKDCILFLWATYPQLPDAFEVIKAWGFTFKTVGFTWVKQNPTGRGFHFGLGYWTRANPEICLLATKGHPKRVSKSVPNLVVAPRRDHSRKPDDVRDRIVSLCGDLPRVELFARERAEGWSAWGNEVQSNITISTQ